MQKIILLAAYSLLIYSNSFGSQAVVDEFVARYLSKNQIPGAAVLVKKNGETVISKGYGIANLEHAVPVKPETVFQSGSIGKQFTATAIMMLVEEGKLGLDDPLSKYLEIPKSWDKITIRHMLTHTSGMGDYPEAFSLQQDYTEEQMLQMVTKQPLQFEPGDKWNYSNLAYVTLGILIHKVSGEFYGDYLKKRVFEPLGMKSTRIITEDEIVMNRAAGYRLDGGAIRNQEWVAPTVNTTADGSLYFTIEDLAKWDEGLEKGTLLRKDSFEKMWTPVILNDGKQHPYGFGWAVNTQNGVKLVEHGGAWQGFATHIARYLDERLTVVVLCNLAGSDPGYMAHRIAGIYNPVFAPKTHTRVSVNSEILKSYEGQYRLEDRLNMIITSTGDKLVAEVMGRKLEFIPEDEINFFEEDSERTIEFTKDQSDKVIGLILRVPTELNLKKVK
jgi:CubicO group peptidase (beta-lactamase class C family)